MVERAKMRGLAWTLQIFTGLGVLFVLAGSVLAFVDDGRLPAKTAPATEIPSGVLAFDPTAILTVGFLLLLAAPTAGLGYLLLAFLRAGERLYAVVAGLVLATLAVSLLVGIITRGG